MDEKISLVPVQGRCLDSWKKHQNLHPPNEYFLGFYEGVEFRILLQFDLSDLPLGSQILEAKLKINCNRNDNKWEEKYYNAHLVTQKWSEEGMTWSKQPLYDLSQKSQTCVQSNTLDYITWDITSFARTWQFYPDSNFGIILLAEQKDYKQSLLGFAGLSRRLDMRPRLELIIRMPNSKIETLRPTVNSSSGHCPKIAILTPQFFESRGDRCLFGGGERYLIDFVNLLQRMGYLVDVYQPSIGQWEKAYDGVKIIGLGDNASDYDFFTEANKLFYYRTQRYDFHIYFNLTVAYPKVFPRSICINHGIWWDSNERSWWRTSGWYQRLFDGLKNLDTLVSVDTNTINWLNAVKPELGVHKVYIPNYIDLDCVETSKVSEKKDYLTVLYPRRLHSSRGWTVSMEVALELISEYENLRFLFVGRGSQRDEEKLREISKAYPRIEYNWYDMKDIYQAYEEADIVLIPSHSSEGTSLSLIEAMAFGKPIIAGLIGGLTDLILPGYNGLLIKITNRNLKNAIIQLIENPELRKSLGENAKEVAQYFSKTIWEERWRTVIEECFSQPRK